MQSASSGHSAEQLSLEDEFALLVLFRCFVRFVVLPTDCLFALAALNITYNVSTCRHVALAGLALCDVDDAVEEVGFAMLAAEVLSRKVGVSNGRGLSAVSYRWLLTLLIMSS